MMRRVFKEVISGSLLVISLLLMIVSYQSIMSPGGFYGLLFFVSVIMVLISIYALIAYSKTGWRMAGSEGDWAGAGILNPWILIFRRAKDDDRDRNDEKEDRKKDDKYYQKRRD
jgi:hypothetical protein